MNAPVTNVLIHQFGEVPGLSLEMLAREVASAYRVNASAGGRLAVPDGGFDPLRAQYTTAAFLKVLTEIGAKESAPDKPAPVRLGITEKDLFVPRLNFVFGEADPESGSAVISTFRLRPEFYGQEPALERLQRRVLKEAVHELGHVFGLEHCDSLYCIMHFSNTIGDTDKKGPGFCRECQIRLAWRGLGHER